MTKSTPNVDPINSQDDLLSMLNANATLEEAMGWPEDGDTRMTLLRRVIQKTAEDMAGPRSYGRDAATIEVAAKHIYTNCVHAHLHDTGNFSDAQQAVQNLLHSAVAAAFAARDYTLHTL